MRTSKRKIAGIILIVAAVVGALAIQFFGPGLISTHSLPIPEPPPGYAKASSVTATYYRWPLLALIALIGVICYLFPYERRQGDDAAS